MVKYYRVKKSPPTFIYVGGVFLKILFEQIINHAIKQEASDIHFIPCEEHTIIKLRIKDELTIYDRLSFPIYNYIHEVSIWLRCINTA